MTALTALQQSLTPGAKVFLYKLDLTPIGVTGGGSEFFGTPSFDVAGEISFGGETFTKMAIQISEIERTGNGENPEPRLTLPNTDKFASALVVAHADLVGAKVYRWVTYDSFLDGRAGADADAYLSYDIFVIEQKLSLDKTQAQFSLRVLADTAGRVVPGRSALRDICPWRYRTYNATTSAFEYDVNKPCPYVGGTYFREDGTPTAAPAEDRCSNDLTGCALRPHPDGILPFGGFPGMSKLRLR